MSNLAPIVVSKPCEHKWMRAPDRDGIAGFPMSSAQLVFYCEKCLAVEVRRVEFAPK